MRVAVGVTVLFQPEQIAELDQALEELPREQPSWKVEVGRGAYSRIVRVELQARGLDEALQAVKEHMQRLVLRSSLEQPLDYVWSRPRQVPL